jgi:hypothetical protein
MPINKLAPQDAFSVQYLHHKESGSKLDTIDFRMKCNCPAFSEAPSTCSYNAEGRAPKTRYLAQSSGNTVARIRLGPAPVSRISLTGESTAVVTTTQAETL